MSDDDFAAFGEDCDVRYVLALLDVVEAAQRVVSDPTFRSSRANITQTIVELNRSLDALDRSSE